MYYYDPENDPNADKGCPDYSKRKENKPVMKGD